MTELLLLDFFVFSGKILGLKMRICNFNFFSEQNMHEIEDLWKMWWPFMSSKLVSRPPKLAKNDQSLTVVDIFAFFVLEIKYYLKFFPVKFLAFLIFSMYMKIWNSITSSSVQQMYYKMQKCKALKLVRMLLKTNQILHRSYLPYINLSQKNLW